MTDADTADGVFPTVLVVDDEKEVADAYALRLRGLADMVTVYHGEDTIDAVRDRDTDVILLDRHMPGLSGDEVLRELRETDFSGRVVMVTAIDPGFDVLDMPFDDYLCKPVERADIRAAVSQQCTILGYEVLGEYFAAESTRSVLEAEIPESERANHEEFQRVDARSTRLKQRARRLLPDADTLFETFEGIEREGR